MGIGRRASRVGLLVGGAAWLLGGLFGITARAQSAEAVETGPVADTTETSMPRAKVLIHTGGSAAPERKRSLAGALEAQLAALDLALEIDVNAPASHDAATRFDLGRSLAREHDARAVFWVELEGDAQWFVYMMDPTDERILVRQVDARAPAAAVEAIAVIVKTSTQALLAGRLDTLDAEELPVPAPMPAPIAPVAAPPAAATAAPASTPPADPASHRGGLRLALGYSGCTFASEHPWQSGLNLSASWIAKSGWYGGLSYTWFAPSTPDDPVAIRVQRHPVAAAFGKRLWRGALAVDLEAGVSVDVWTRHTEDVPNGVEASSRSTRLTVALAPRIRAELTLWQPLALYLDLGLAYLINNFEYITANPERALLSPHTLRAELGAGLALTL